MQNPTSDTDAEAARRAAYAAAILDRYGQSIADAMASVDTFGVSWAIVKEPDISELIKLERGVYEVSRAPSAIVSGPPADFLAAYMIIAERADFSLDQFLEPLTGAVARYSPKANK